MKSILIDANPLVHRLTGIGRFTESLIHLTAYSNPPDLDFHYWVTATHWVPHGLHGKEYLVNFHHRYAYWYLPYVPENIDVIHYTNAMNPPLNPFSKGKVNLVTIHDLALLHPEYKWVREKGTIRWKVNRTIEKSDWFCCVSETTRQDLEDLFPQTRGRTDVIYLDLPVMLQTRMNEIRRLTNPETRPFFLFIGSLNERKNPGFILELLDKLPDRIMKSFQFIFIGDDGNQSHMFNAYKGHPSVKRLGYVDDQTVYRYLNHATALLVPSRYEGFGINVMEALALGTRVLAADIPVFRELYADKVALLPDTPDAWIPAIENAALETTKRDPFVFPKIVSQPSYFDLYRKL